MLLAFGFVAVTAMVATYALEPRSPRFIVAFAVACVLGATNALATEAWPFAALEFVWAGVALQRWNGARLAPNQTAGAAIPDLAVSEVACDMGVLDQAEREQHGELSKTLRNAAAVDELADGYRLRFESEPGRLESLAGWVALEQRCCPFLRFDLGLAGDSIALALRGPSGAKAVLAEDFGDLAASRPAAGGDPA